VKRTPGRSGVVATAVCAVALALSGCALPGTAAPRTTSDAGGSAAPAPPPPGTAASPGMEASPAPGVPFGPGCGVIPPRGEGSFAGMADDPFATAVSHTPAARALTSAIAAARLAKSFDSQQDVTVLVPSDEAFAAVPRDALNALMGDTAQLTAVLTHHVLQGRLTPDRLAGIHTTLNNDEVTIAVTPQAFTIAADGTLTGAAVATIVCGNVQTANATLYLIDQVLAPPAA
jgi:uncharacterized surface protein with fasciclin (FAS1) repeats